MDQTRALVNAPEAIEDPAMSSCTRCPAARDFAPAKEAVEWNTPARIFKPLRTETSSICKYFEAKTECPIYDICNQSTMNY